MNILIIEDEIVTATDLKKTLEKRGHRVLPICKNYQEALQVTHDATPDLVLADIRLRNSAKDGIETASEITAGLHIPIIYLTSYTDHQTFEKARNTRPAAYLFKPFRKEELVFQIELALEHYKVNKPAPRIRMSWKTCFSPSAGGIRKYTSGLYCLSGQKAPMSISSRLTDPPR